MVGRMKKMFLLPSTIFFGLTTLVWEMEKMVASLQIIFSMIRNMVSMFKIIFSFEKNMVA